MTNRYTQTQSRRPVIKFPYFCDFRTIVCYILITLITSSQLASGEYLNEIAVHVRGGRSVVDRIAERHGFINQGQIGNLKDHYLLEHPHIHKRSVSPSHVHYQRLSREPEILWFEQQFVKKRVKRDLTFTDQLWNKEWYLHGGGRRGRNGPGGFDMGVKGAWKMGYTGRGVVITILDDGIERDHPDLIENYDPYASTDINSHDSDPMPRYDFSNENRHGTRCAGEVAAKANNSNCIVGVAYNSGIGGVRMLDGKVYDKVEADSLSHNHTHVDIYSASWGPDDDGRVVDGPGPLAKKSFIEGITNGRGKKGNIFMWASGNGGRAEDSCSCDGYTNSIYTLSISSTSQNGGKPWYLEECSSTLATTYSSGAPDEQQIITTDLRKRCTETHTGTSASAPLAAGLVALALEANPNLTWRDVQYITLLSANPEPMADGQWRVNGMGRKVSLRYGYGLMNATEMVSLAERWTTVPTQHTCTISGSKQNVPLYKYSMFEDQITTDGCGGSSHEVRYLEHVHVRISLKYKRRGDLTINLVSPSGTNSTLLPKRNRDMSDGGFNNWEFLSVHFWEENPAGSWTLRIVDQINPYAGTTQQGTLVKWALVLYGTQDKPVNLKDTNPPVTPTYTCHSQCVDTCTGPNPEDCTRCKSYRIQNGPCVQSCPTAYRADRDLCVPCSANCQYCITVSGSREHCRKCKAGMMSIENEGTCVNSCPPGYFRVGASTVCRRCAQQCELCENTSSHCLRCVSGMVLKDNKCVLPPKLCPEDITTESPVPTTAIPANTTNPAARSDIECESNVMSLHVPLNLLPVGQQVTWNDPSCVVADNGTHLTGSIGLGDCGTFVVFNNTHVTFENELVSHAGPGNGTSRTQSGIDFGAELNSVVVVQCVYPRREQGSIAFRPIPGHVRFYEKTLGHMEVRMRQARDLTFADTYESQSEPHKVHLNDQVFIKLSTDQGNVTTVAINVDRCLATPSSSPLDTDFQELTNNGCPAISSVTIHSSPASEVHLSFHAFQFTNHPGAPVYVHCEVYVCPLSNPHCVAGCTDTVARSRRAATDGIRTHLVSTGPFPVVDEKEEGVVGQSTALIAVTGLCACLAVVATVFGILAWKGRRRLTAKETVQ